MRHSTEGSFTITGTGVETSSVSLGSSVSKALTIANRMQHDGLIAAEGKTSIYVRRLGEEVAARIDVQPHLIETFVFVKTK